MAESVIMGFLGDLFPRRIEDPRAVAAGISRYAATADLRGVPAEIQDVVRTAAEWQGGRKPRGRLFKPAPPPAGEQEFLHAAARAFERYG